jgi:cbb3-type cytochrome oxidase maturation protein
MDILFLLVPLSVLLALAVMAVLAWAVWSGQFDDLESEGQRIFRNEKNQLESEKADEADVGKSARVSPEELIHVNTVPQSQRHTTLQLRQPRDFQ